jgi:hypothetical protein
MPTSNQSPMQSQHGSVPVPDLTVLTTASLMREIGLLKELMESKMADFVFRFEHTSDERDKRYEQRFMAQEQSTKTAFESQQLAMAAALAAADRAVAKAEVATEKRFDSVNEFREQLKDQANTLMTRSESDARMSSMTEKIDRLTNRADMRDGKGDGLTSGWGFLVGGIGILCVIISTFIAVYSFNKPAQSTAPVPNIVEIAQPQPQSIQPIIVPLR